MLSLLNIFSKLLSVNFGISNALICETRFKRECETRSTEISIFDNQYSDSALLYNISWLWWFSKYYTLKTSQQKCHTFTFKSVSWTTVSSELAILLVIWFHGVKTSELQQNRFFSAILVFFSSLLLPIIKFELTNT